MEAKRNKRYSAVRSRQLLVCIDQSNDEPRLEGVNLELFCGGTWRKAAGVAKEA